MGKMLFSLRFWMTIVLFIALGFAFRSASGAECFGSMNRGYQRAAFRSSASSSEDWSFENDLRGRDVARSARCAPNTVPRSNYLDFQQMANLQAGGPTYAPGFSLTITRRPPEVSLCPGPVEIPRH